MLEKEHSKLSDHHASFTIIQNALLQPGGIGLDQVPLRFMHLLGRELSNHRGHDHGQELHAIWISHQERGATQLSDRTWALTEYFERGFRQGYMRDCQHLQHATCLRSKV